MTPEEYAQIRDAYKPLAAETDFDDYGPAEVPGGTFEYLGKYVRLSEITDKQVASLIAGQFVNVCAQARGAGVPYQAGHIGNLIAEALVTHGGFHRADQCFGGLEPEQPKSLTPAKYEPDDDDDECIGLEDMVGWLKEGLFLAGAAGAYADVTNTEEAEINGTFDLDAVAEYMMLHIWDDEEEDDE